MHTLLVALTTRVADVRSSSRALTSRVADVIT